jgi:hypothetical protein
MPDPQGEGGSPMPRPTVQEATAPDKVELARRLYKEFYVRCFWHMDANLDVQEATIPLIVKGLKTHGGRRGLLAAAELEK